MNDSEVRIGTELDTSQAEKQSEKLGKSLAKNIGGGAKTAIKGVAAIGTTMVAAGGVAVGSLVKMAKATAETGDHIDKMSQKIGMSAEAYQKWDYVARISGTSIDGLRMGFRTLTNTIDKANKGNAEAVDKFKQVGVSMDDLKNKSREQIFEDTIKGLQNMKDETERSALANKLLGRAGMELGPMLNSTNADLDKLMKTAEDYGMIMSDKAVKASAQFQDSVTTMQMTLQGMKNRMMAEFLPALTQVTDGMALLFKGDTEDGLAKMEEGISGLMDKIVEVLPTVLKLGGSIIKSIGKGIIDNLPSIIQTGISIISSLIGALVSAIPQITQSVISGIGILVAQIGEQLPVLINQLITAFQSAIPLIISALPQIFQNLINGAFDVLGAIFDNLPQLVDMAIQIIIGLTNALISAIPLLVSKLPELIQKVVDGLIASLPLLINGAISLVLGIVKALPQIIMSLVKALPQIIKSVVSGLLSALPLLIKGAITLVVELVKNLPQIIVSLISAIPQIIGDVVDALIDNIPLLIKANITMIVELVKAMPKIIKSLISAIPKIVVSIIAAFNKMGSKYLEIGLNMIKGIWNGIKNAGKWLMDKIKGFLGGVVDGIKDFLGIKSPSRLMRDEVGKMMALGMYQGFKDNNPMAQIKKDLATGVGSLQSSINMQWSASSIGNAVSNAIDGLTVSVGGRTFGRIVRSY